MDNDERGFETAIVMDMTGEDGLSVAQGASRAAPLQNSNGWLAGCPEDFDRRYAIDAAQLFTFLRDTQPDEWEKLGIANPDDKENNKRVEFLARIDKVLREIGIIYLLKKGIQHHNADFTLYYPLPSEGDEDAKANYNKNRFSVTRQLKFSKNAEKSVDLGMFINGFPVITAELKNNLTGQAVYDAVKQYRDRDATELLFTHGRCAVHFALDEHSVNMCTHLRGKDSDFHPFNKGHNGGAGNPPNPAGSGFSTDYLWKEILHPNLLSEIVENYARLLEQGEQKQQIWPRYHQLDAVRMFLGRVQKHNVGKRYSAQHSAGSGKSKTIAWLALRLAKLDAGSEGGFNSVFVVSNRRVLDGQLKRDIEFFSDDVAIAGHAKTSRKLCRLIENKKKVIITTIQKFPHIIDLLDAQQDKKFAVIIDEAHAGQTGKTATQMHAILGSGESGDAVVEADDTGEDVINRIINNRRMAVNASYFAFTATPKPKTLELFGERQEQSSKNRPHHTYSMKQAIEEGFILDVLDSYTPVETAFNIIKTVADDPKFDTNRAQKKLRKFVETHPETIEEKAKVMVEHFYGCKIDRNIGGQARAMVVCRNIASAVEYYFAIKKHIEARGKTDKALVAFSGEHDYNGTTVTESKLNGFPETQTAGNFQKIETARFLVCAEKFQVGYDEPLLQVMYVDKPLSGVMAVQTLSRINRAHPQKDSCMILDFCNSQEVIRDAFQNYYQTTVLMDKADPNKLHDIKDGLDNAGIYSAEDVEKFIRLFFCKDRKKYEHLLSICRDKYNKKETDEQIKFKGDVKSFCRSYEFIAMLLSYNMPAWEKLSIFLTSLISKLPSPQGNSSRDILKIVDLESYLAHKQQEWEIKMENEDGEIAHPEEEEGGVAEPEVEALSIILTRFNRQFSEIIPEGEKSRKLFELLERVIVPMIENNKRYKSSRENTPNEAPNDFDRVFRKIKVDLNAKGEDMYIDINNPNHWEKVKDWVYKRVSKG